MDLKSALATFSPFLTLIIGFLLNKYFTNRPKLIAYYQHISVGKFITQEEGSQRNPIFTHTIIIRNDGRVTAKNIRVGHKNLDSISLNVYPDCPYEQINTPEGGKEIIFPVLVPNE